MSALLFAPLFTYVSVDHGLSSSTVCYFVAQIALPLAVGSNFRLVSVRCVPCPHAPLFLMVSQFLA